MEVMSTARAIRVTPRKARLVAATVVGLPVDDALTALKFLPRAAAHDVASVIKSAAANAEHNYSLGADDLHVARVEVNPGPTIKRIRPRAQGRAFGILKRTSHLRAFVSDDREAARRAGAGSATSLVRRASAAPVTPVTAAESTPSTPVKPKTRVKKPAAAGTDSKRSRAKKVSAPEQVDE